MPQPTNGLLLRMDAKLKEDLFRRYVAALERRLEEGAGGGPPPEGGKGRHKDSEALLSTATALLGAYQPDPGQRFRMVRFYEVVENSLRCQRGGIKGLERAFHTLETICTNLLLFPWKKEFRSIKVGIVIRFGLFMFWKLSSCFFSNNSSASSFCV